MLKQSNLLTKANLIEDLFGGFGMLSKSRLGIIGYGRLGKIVNKIAKGFGMKTLTCDIKKKILKKHLKKLFFHQILSHCISLQKKITNFFLKKHRKNFKTVFSY